MSGNNEFICPRCNVVLEEARTSKGMFWACNNCNGRAITVELLRRIFTPDSINPLWKHAISGEGISSRSCPACGKAMIEVNLSENASVRVDVCRHCHFVWFDSGETESLVPRPPKTQKPSMPQKAREAMALFEVDRLAREADRIDESDINRASLWGSIFSAINLW